MNMIPQPKEYKSLPGCCDTGQLNWCFADNTDARVIKAAHRISNDSTGLPVYIAHTNSNGEGYTLHIKENEIRIEADSGAGAFYALMTLKMLRNKKRVIDCCEISDAPDMAYRGFYQDSTRGRIPTLATLKKLVDTMADYKMNSLQLYIEHSYAFKEYNFCRNDLGYLTKAEIQELDCYCRERFIELVPSLSCFGHLYHLLQSDTYKHLCELKDYIPSNHYFVERMRHHTINPLLDESFELITSLIDQHSEAFTSNKFNICCDETFDLGTDVNQDQDKGELYIGFVKKLVSYLEAKGKTVMMWGDIVLQYPDKLGELSEQLIFLNWDYSEYPEEEKITALKDHTQLVCPGTSSWEGFLERVRHEEGNILKMAEYGAKYGATGILNTNWGDLGNPASIDMAMYGLILGACAGWNTKTRADSQFHCFVSSYHYGCDEAMDILTALGGISDYSNWLSYHYNWSEYPDSSESAFKNAMSRCESLIGRITQANFADPSMKEVFVIAAQGESLVISWNAARQGYAVKSSVDFHGWLQAYRNNWLKDSKQSELDVLTDLFTAIHRSTN